MSMEFFFKIFKHADNLTDFLKGETIFAEGNDGKSMFAVIDGAVDIVKSGMVLETVEPGGIFGEMALIDDLPRSASAVARTDCRVAAIDPRRFQFLVQETPFFALHVMRLLSARLRRNTP